MNIGVLKETKSLEKRVGIIPSTVKDLTENNKIRGFKMFSSMDTWGERAESVSYTHLTLPTTPYV